RTSRPPCRPSLPFCARRHPRSPGPTDDRRPKRAPRRTLVTDQRLDDLALSRPEPAPDRGPLDDGFYDLVESRFRRIVRDHPDFATFIGIHTEDHRLGSGERDAVL